MIIGARDTVLKKYITPPEIIYKAFDLDPIDEEAKVWDIEKPFPYQSQLPQIITMLEIVEHLKNQWICMKNLFEIISPGGYLILTTPNSKWSHAHVDLLKNGYISCFSPSDPELNHHVFTPWPRIINKLLTDSGL